MSWSGKIARARVLVLAISTLLLGPRAIVYGQEPALDATYTQLEPKEHFKYKYKIDGQFQQAVCNAGVFRWEVPRTEYGTGGLDRNFTGYCAEVLVPIVADKTYRFRTNNLYAPDNYKLTGAPKDKVGDAGNRRARLVQELFGRHFRDPVRKSVSGTDAVAFQIALWEIIQEAQPAEGDPELDLFAGDFQADYPKADAPAYVVRAQEYLNTLTGTDEGLLMENPDLRGRELIRLQGIENADGVVAQSQFALRYRGGSGAGTGAFARPLTATGGGIPLLGGSGSSSPGLGGGGGPFPAGTGQTSPLVSGPDAPGATPASNSTVPVGADSTPSSTPADTTLVDGPDTPGGLPPVPPGSVPVPAPGGLLLGAIAFGAVAAWRAGAKVLAK